MLRGGEWFKRLVGAVARRSTAVIAVMAVLALAGAVLALRLDPSTGTDTIVSEGSSTFKDTERFKQDFGDEPVIVLVKGNLQRTVLTSDLGRLIKLEGCLSGNVPAEGLKQLPKQCAELAKLKPARVVFGPGTFINTAANQITGEFSRAQQGQAQQADAAAKSAQKASAKRGDPPAEQKRLAAAARKLSQERFTREVLSLALKYGITGIPSVDNADFVSTLVFDSRSGKVGEPKARFAYLFPSNNSAAIQVRMRPDMTEQERNRAIELINQVTKDKTLVPKEGGKYVVTGVPVVVEGLASAVRTSIFVLLGAALLLMAGTLALVFRTPRMRLLPLAIALGAAALTFGGLSLVGGNLTMASIAVLPVLIGLAVDYSIQFQARFDELRADRGLRPEEAAPLAAAAGGPTIASAGIATAVGFLVLLLSPVPIVRGFGALLVVGILIALACALTAGFAALVKFSDPAPRPDVPPMLPRVRARGRAVGDWLGAKASTVAASRPGEWVHRRWRISRLWVIERSERGIAYSMDKPKRVLAVGLAVAIVGWAADTQSKVVSDIQELVPANLQALKDARTLQDESGVSGEIDVTIRADDVTEPDVIRWMSDFQGRVLKDGGYQAGDRCAQSKNPPDICPALSLPDLFSSVNVSEQAQVRGLLDAIPPYFSQGVVTQDRKTANLAFGIRLQSLDKQKDVVDKIKEQLDPPDGVTASVVGLPVLAAEANSELASPWRRALTLFAALLAVFLVLLAFRRSRREASVPLIPIALASGWAAGILFILGLLPGPFKVELNPMSVTLGALVIAISTEFSVLLSARYREEREAGAAPARAIELTYASTGAAVIASGVTAIAGFAALIVSDIRMLRDFGILTVVDLSVALIGVMLLLPAALVWAEEHGPFGWRDLDPRPFFREVWAAIRSIRQPRFRRPRRPAISRLRRRGA